MKFEVFKDGRPFEGFKVLAGYMFGADSIPLRPTARIKSKNGIIECKKRSLETAGLALLWPVDGFGTVLLPTTRLPEHKEPYNLNVELARAKLMQIVLKREEWSLFEETTELADMAHEAQGLFIEALQNMSEPAQASMLADESLKKAMLFSEQLAARNAEAMVAEKCTNRMLTRHTLGCCIDPKLLGNEIYCKRLFDMFGFVTIPISWAQIEVNKGEYDFSVMDRCVELLMNRRLAICAGSLLRFSPECLPKWLVKDNPPFEQIRDAAYSFVSKTVERYAGRIHAWRVISGMNVLNHFGFDFEQVIEMTRSGCFAAKSSDAKSRKLVEILFPWGEYYSAGGKTIPPLVYADMIIQHGTSFDGFGLQMQFGKPAEGMYVRDMMQISSRLDDFSAIARSMHITDVAIPGAGPADGESDSAAGLWHHRWDQSTQGEWIEEFCKVALGKPFINSVTYSSLIDSEDNVVPACGLLTEKFEPKKALLSMARLQKRILNR